MALIARAEDVTGSSFVSEELTSGGALSTLVLGGARVSLIVADREPGYHSAPHRHAAEQLNFVAAGELWIFVGEEGFLACEGDFFRIPADAVHWSWVKGDQPCRLIEAHSPSVADDDMWRDGAFTCYASDEADVAEPGAINVFLDRADVGAEEIEAKYFGASSNGED